MDSPPLWLPHEEEEGVRVTVSTENWEFLSELRHEIDAALAELENEDEGIDVHE